MHNRNPFNGWGGGRKKTIHGMEMSRNVRDVDDTHTVHVCTLRMTVSKTKVNSHAAKRHNQPTKQTACKCNEILTE